MTTSGDRPPLPALTGLRFLAALHVVVYHALRPALVPAHDPLSLVAAAGPTAVTLFFVLSGFVLTYVYAPSVVDGRSFARARFARIAPVYWLALLVALPIGVIARAKGAVHDPLGGASLLLVATGLQAWVPTAALRWNAPAWSLSCELFFYALFPLLLASLSRRSTTTALAIGALAWLAGLALPVTYLALAPDGLASPTIVDEGLWLNLVKLSPLARLPDFIVGVVAGRLFVEGRRVPTALGALGLAVPLVVVATGLVPGLVEHNGLYAPLFALAIASLAGGAGPLARALSSSPLRLLGEASYALYLVHVPMFLWALALTKQRELPVAAALVVGALAVPVSVAVFVLVERPLRARLRGVSSPSS
jgi:peptidoglycan/LPS O-acetylase OafA/YrhL